eukprot:1156013-Pelagomonas_calceolata.AAC.11
MPCRHAQVFYDAKDAVAFCLQAQQMLGLQQWPSPKEENGDDDHSTPLTSPYAASVSELLSKKSRSNQSFSLLHPLSSSKDRMKRQSMIQGTSDLAGNGVTALNWWSKVAR